MPWHGWYFSPVEQSKERRRCPVAALQPHPEIWQALVLLNPRRQAPVLLRHLVGALPGLQTTVPLHLMQTPSLELVRTLHERARPSC